MFRNRSNHRFWTLLYGLITLSLIAACGTTPLKSIADVKPDESMLRVGVSANASLLIYKQEEKVVGLAVIDGTLSRFIGGFTALMPCRSEKKIPLSGDLPALLAPH
ncbi:MAG: hypothetical protein PVH55_12375 [Desulfobacterales bacterium]|jgi:hypothetical protein